MPSNFNSLCSAFSQGFKISKKAIMASNSTSTASPMDIDGESHVDIDRESTETNQKRNLKMISGSFYISKDSASNPQGEDAHFICEEKQAMGVADGVGGWVMQGINAGIYATQLMTNTVNAIQNEPEGQIDPIRVLKNGYSRTRVAGSSTACIMALEGNRLKVANVGDSGFVRIRKGSDVYQSPIQQHYFSCPYQLEYTKRSCDTRQAEAFSIPLEAGDVIVAGTDGLFDNLFADQIEECARMGIEKGLDPNEVAWSVAEHAYGKSLDKCACTPFMEASVKAGKGHRGGKPDDITVIVAYIVDA